MCHTIICLPWRLLRIAGGGQGGRGTGTLPQHMPSSHALVHDRALLACWGNGSGLSSCVVRETWPLPSTEAGVSSDGRSGTGLGAISCLPRVGGVSRVLLLSLKPSQCLSTRKDAAVCGSGLCWPTPWHCLCSLQPTSGCVHPSAARVLPPAMPRRKIEQ